ncbi:hypothetical protein DWY35_11890 [Ruminococcus sp. AF25-13]|jgi:hypothetical protein|nr:bacteriophage Gp15 family protein [Mediterraneibacter faecis]RGD82116.1 hypothetical protein DXD07_10275 [Ruminococcus sp. TF10-6]RGF27312.1 hypothetical protein DW106_10250 [Ruminococcus sp. AM09-18-1]RGG27347.1 hypothetical protein DWY35_11890 [Ruminococcus sp. AF25-13]RGI14515.1 hypothetical protein DXD00_09975 [Ruminococcus sp. TF10-12AC]DAZ45395.1 MAG TPA: hypothetical protein [Caudoviricetes sp.]
MNILIDKFPEFVSVDGKEYPVETDFRKWIRLMKLVEDDSVPENVKCGLMMQWYTDAIPDDLEAAIDALGEFLAMNPGEKEEIAPVQSSKQVYSYEEDMTWIYSAFREVYGIDLQKIEYMHWWEFQTLFTGLPESTEIKQRMMYRSIDLRTVKDKDERKRIKRIQDAIALKKRKRKMTDYEIGDMFA